MIKVIEFITEAVAWLKIVAAPFLIGVGLGALVYYSNPSTCRFILGISLVLMGLIVGMVWASRIWKKNGTTWFMSRVSAFPELSKKDEKKEGNESSEEGMSANRNS
ncbi:MAG: hypothetical protein KF880_08045 [Ferruginibacter sp.]|nr:hypothetical protein [Ferruginibacter sp.]